MNSLENKKLVEEKDPRVHARFEKNNTCSKCYREKSDCICKKVTSFSNKLQVIILQHPQEQFKKLNSAHLCGLILRNCKVFAGLSWPNFKSVAGENELPSQWGILYLKGHAQSASPVEIFDRKDQQLLLNDIKLRGIIALDGSWKQAKTLWWRNPWFLKLNRITLNPEHESLRNQSKKEGLSTIESVALALRHLGEKSTLADSMVWQYEKLILSKPHTDTSQTNQHTLTE